MKEQLEQILEKDCTNFVKNELITKLVENEWGQKPLLFLSWIVDNNYEMSNDYTFYDYVNNIDISIGDLYEKYILSQKL